MLAPGNISLSMPFEMLQITVEYSNAVLVAIMPYVSDFANRLQLPIPQPITVAQVQKFGCSPFADHVGGRVFLTNGYSFSFDQGGVVLYRSPNAYFSLQDPNRVPEFYGTVSVTKDDAVRIARDALKNLGYTDSVLHFDQPPKVTLPPRSEGKHIARYLVEWLAPFPDSTKPLPHGLQPKTAMIEVDATTGQIEMLGIPTKDARRPDPKIAVHPPVLAGKPQSEPVGGTRVEPVSAAYSRAFLLAILPHLSDYVKRAGLDVKTPIMINDVDMPSYTCGFVRNDPSAIIYLRIGDRFVYSHGQVIEYEASDSFSIPEPNKPLESKPREKFYGPVNTSVGQALSIVTNAINHLGYSSQIPLLREKPEIVPPRKDGTNYFARYFFIWARDGEQVAGAEIDASTKRLKRLFIDDLAFRNIWREPPRIDVPIGPLIPDQAEPSSPPPPAVPMPRSVMPP